jgi:endonuclease/exonuclease/phosphatase (EEP) superfamily protein YafD
MHAGCACGWHSTRSHQIFIAAPIQVARIAYTYNDQLYRQIGDRMAANNSLTSIEFRRPATVVDQPRQLDDLSPAANRSSSVFRRVVWWGVYVGAWCSVLVLGVLAALQIFYHDATLPLVWVSSFTRYVYLPAYLCVAWSAWQRRWVLLIGGLVIVACHVTWMVPDFVRDRRFDTGPGTATGPSPTLRVFFANLAASNNEHQPLLNEIAASDPDIVVLAEFSWPWHIAFKKSPIMVPYKYGTGWLRTHIGLINVFSKLPLKTEEQNWVTGRPIHTVEVQLGDKTLRLIGLHAPRPMDLPNYDYYGYWKQTLPILLAERGPVVIVGDFNATEHSRVYDELTTNRYHSAHDERGRGWAVTWPNGKVSLPPVRIDQVLLSPEVECVRIVEGVGKGSDHKPVIADVRIRGSSNASSVSSQRRAEHRSARRELP